MTKTDLTKGKEYTLNLRGFEEEIEAFYDGRWELPCKCEFCGKRCNKPHVFLIYSDEKIHNECTVTCVLHVGQECVKKAVVEEE